MHRTPERGEVNGYIGPVYSNRRDQPEVLRHQQGSPGRTAQRDCSEEAPGPVLGDRPASGAVQENRLVSLRGPVQHQADVAVVAQNQAENPAGLFNACEFRLMAAPDHGQPVAGGTVKRLGVRCWAGYDRPSFWLAGDQGWDGFCAWWRLGSRGRAEAST